jgi:hypothetical protein
MSEPIAIPGLEQTSTASPLVASKADCNEDPVIQNKSSTDVPTESFTQSEKESTPLLKKRKHYADGECTGITSSSDSEDYSEITDDSHAKLQKEQLGQESTEDKAQALTHHRYGPIAVSLIGSIIVF